MPSSTEAELSLPRWEQLSCSEKLILILSFFSSGSIRLAHENTPNVDFSSSYSPDVSSLLCVVVLLSHFWGFQAISSDWRNLDTSSFTWVAKMGIGNILLLEGSHSWRRA